MSLSLTLDVVISLIFTWLLAALLTGAVNEVIAGLLKLRGVYLTKGIETLTSLGKNNVFSWGGKDASIWDTIGGWLKAHFCRSGPSVSNAADIAAIEAEKRANDAAKATGATAASIVAAVKGTANFAALDGLEERLNYAVQAPHATSDTVATMVRRIAGVANLQTNPLLVGTPTGLPSYVPARDFATALLGVLAEGADPTTAFTQTKGVINDLPNGDLKKTLLSFIDTGADDINKLRTCIENWFDDAMERVGGIYKRFTQYVMLALGLIVAIGLNVDSIHVAKTLWEQPTLAKAIADQATKYLEEEGKRCAGAQTGAANGTTALDANCLQQSLSTTRDLVDKQTLPIGRKPGEAFFGWNVGTLFGWLITAFAISLGAQFWFDLLIKFTNLRAAGPKPERADAAKTT